MARLRKISVGVATNPAEIQTLERYRCFIKGSFMFVCAISSLWKTLPDNMIAQFENRLWGGEVYFMMLPTVTLYSVEL
jgi:hypothetical protein